MCQLDAYSWPAALTPAPGGTDPRHLQRTSSWLSGVDNRWNAAKAEEVSCNDVLVAVAAKLGGVDTPEPQESCRARATRYQKYAPRVREKKHHNHCHVVEKSQTLPTIDTRLTSERIRMTSWVQTSHSPYLPSSAIPMSMSSHC
jgi:hypothetical protein